MLALEGYQILSLVYESTNSLIYRGIQERDEQRVILKVFKSEYPTPYQLTRYQQEYEIISSLEGKGVAKVYGLHNYQRTLVIVLEDCGILSLKELIDEQFNTHKRGFSLEQFLTMAIAITEGLGNIHIAHIIHKDINPSNIVYNPETGKIKIIDFGISTYFSPENPHLKTLNTLEGTLTYISPEQTGRMNRSLDYRTDFYSLGVTFYELLTGQLPFNSQDTLELIHCHIAKKPVPPQEINPEIPPIISEIIMKLMAKNAEDRYQIAFGIKADLERCLNQLTTGKIKPFPLGLQDISNRFHIPEKLYGREREVKTLLDAFVAVTTSPIQPRQIMLVAGYSGIGKSALVQELYKPITEKRGYFITGKFEQFQRNIPYSAVVNSFRGLVQQLLTESETQLQQWREKILTAVGSNAQVIIDVIPEVELIIGKQSPVSELEPSESQNRFNLVFQNFIRVLSQKEHPLAIFLDDLQWADSASLNLIQLILTDTEEQYLFLIGSYRDNEVNPTHPLILTLEALEQAGVTINQITLNPLNQIQISQLIADTLHSSLERVQSLAKLIYLKTDGNPFFVNQFLKTLYSESLISFNFNQHEWQWDIEKIQVKDITNNVVELMIVNLKKAPPDTQTLLQLAACIGSDFSLDTLALIAEKAPSLVFSDLKAALRSGLILAQSHLDIQGWIQHYKFLHDRVQQAAYSCISDSDKKAIHLKIARLLFTNLPPQQLSERIFEVVAHLNQGYDLICDRPEQLNLVQLNLEAARKATDATAYLSAKSYLEVAQKFLPESSWKSDYNLILALYQQKAILEYLTGNFEGSEALINLIVLNVKSTLEQAEIYNILIVQKTMQGQYLDGIEVGKKALKLLEIELPTANFEAALNAEVEQANFYLKDREISDLFQGPEMSIPEKRLAVQLLMNIDVPAYLVAPELYPVIVGKMTNLSLQYGLVSESAKAFVTYGLIQGSLFGHYKMGYEFGLLGVKISERFKSQAQKCKSCLILANQLTSWVKPMKQVNPINQAGYQAGLESGEFQFAGYIVMYQLLYPLFEGVNLETLFSKIEGFLQFAIKIKNQLAVDTIEACQSIILNLTNRTSNPLDFNLNQIIEWDWIEQCQTHHSFLALCQFYLLKAQVLYGYQYFEDALIAIGEAQTLISSTLGLITVAELTFYHSLILASLYPESSPETRQQYWQILEENQQKMDIWVENCPENFEHKFVLVAAEMARISGHILEAMELYDRSIALAKTHQFVQHEALANELAARFWLAQNKEEFAQLYLKKAHYNYQLWGAKRKVEDLEQKYPQLLAKSSSVSNLTSSSTPFSLTSTESHSGEILDLAAMIKATQAISSEIVLDKFLENLMVILLQNAGAQKGYLILETDGEFKIEASGNFNSNQVDVLQSLSLEDHLPISLINYVARTQNSMVLNHATLEGKFINDPYIRANKPQSILCAPLLNRGQLGGMIYLENNLTSGAFTPDRLQIIQLLSGQAAISIENSRLYQTLEEKIRKRTAELANANQEITELNQLLQAENIRMSAELDVTRKLQQMVLPKLEELAVIEELEIAGFMEPAHEVGGDYYDILPKDGKVKISIGDVTGHGLESGVLMLMTQTAIRTLQESNQTDPLKFLDILNRTIYRNVQRINPFKNLTLALLDYDHGMLTLSGQHEEIIVIRTNGTIERIDTIDLGFPIGLEEEIADFIAQEQIQLNSGDIVVLYTDGITEAENIHHQQYGLQRLCEIVQQNRKKTAFEIQEIVIDNLRDYIGEQMVYDDITLVILKQK